MTQVGVAQDYPTKPVRIVVPFPPGSNTDFCARKLANGPQGRLSQHVVVENKPGAASLIGTELVSRATPDGYTLLVTSSSLVTTSVLNKVLRFDIAKDLAPIMLGAEQLIALSVTPQITGDTLDQVIADLKQNPGKYN